MVQHHRGGIGPAGHRNTTVRFGQQELIGLIGKAVVPHDRTICGEFDDRCGIAGAGQKTIVHFPISKLELLQLYSAGLSDEHLHDLKVLIAKFLFAKARVKADQIWDEKKYTDELVRELLSKWRIPLYGSYLIPM